MAQAEEKKDPDLRYRLDIQHKAGQNIFYQTISKAKHHTVEFSRQLVSAWSNYKTLPSETIRSLKTLSRNNGIGYLGRQLLWFLVLLAAGFAFELFFYRTLKGVQHRNLRVMPTCILSLFTKLFIRMLMDLAGLLVFGSIVLSGFILFFPSQGTLYDICGAFLPGIFIIRITYILLKFLYSPRAPHMRIVPQDCPSSGLYFLGILSFVTLTILLKQGFLLLKTNGMNLDAFLLYYSIIGVLQFGVLITILWKDRERILRYLLKTVSNETAAAEKSKTHLGWILCGLSILICFEILWQLNLFLYKKDLTLPLLLTILSIPFGYLMFSIGNRLLLIASGNTELMDPRIMNKDILKPGMDLLKIINVELPETYELPEKSSPVKSVMKPYIPLLRKFLATLISLLLLFWILALWGLKIPVGMMVVRSALTIFIMLLLSYITWEACRAFIDLKIKEEKPRDENDEGDGEGGAGGSRKATILALVRRFIMSGLIIVVIFTVLNAFGINIGPLMAGAGILGIAIGFGSQALVKDILSGLFFLIDDAFRVGDYIETGGVKGTVQQISLRSVKVRHPRGMLFTIPYGDMGSIQNYSRDYIVTKLNLRVRYDADIDKIRKIIKKIDAGIHKDEELSAVLMGKIKSQGVREMDDSAMILRVKFKTIPGKQFLIRKEVYKRVQEAFRENGIEFAHKNVTVYLPPESSPSAARENNSKKDLIKAGAAAATADITPQ